MPVTRRTFLAVAGASAAGAVALGAGSAAAMAAEGPSARVSPAEALERLKRGNTRAANGRTVQRNYSPLAQTPAKGQEPFAAVVSCADSRVVPDTVFDMVPGNLFVVRNAGNSIEEVGLGSLEYGVAVLGVSLIVVLGHTRCGAVIATEDTIKTGEMPPPSIDSVVQAIEPALLTLPAGHSIDDAIAANATYQARQVQALSPLIAKETAAGTVGIVSGLYGLASGRVTWLA